MYTEKPLGSLFYAELDRVMIEPIKELLIQQHAIQRELSVPSLSPFAKSLQQSAKYQLEQFHAELHANPDEIDMSKRLRNMLHANINLLK